MQLLAFDGRMGASGDMLLGSLVAAGADPTVLASVETVLPVRYDVTEVDRNGIRATRVVVRHTGTESVESGVNTLEAGDAHDEGGHDHDHDHGDGGHEHDHEHDHDHAEGHGPHRSYDEVRTIVASMGLPRSVERAALAIFERLGEAEAAVHGTELPETHFHEVGADDAIADVTGVCLLLDDLGAERVVTTPLATGGGAVSMSHGTYPVPAPAVVNLAAGADWAIRGGPVDAELLTPTGAAILAHVAEGVDTLPSMTVSATGYGAGGRTFPEHPNVLRAVVGEARGELLPDEIRVLETNVDDVPPEVLGDLHESLPAIGARDVSVVPLMMKKSRPGHLVRVVVAPEDAARVARQLAAETGTLGVRETGVRHRFVAERSFETVTITHDDAEYDVGLKVATDDAGTVLDVSAEYDDAARVARETALPVREVMRRAEASFERDR